MSDPTIYTAQEAAKLILDALEAAGDRHSDPRPTSYDFSGRREIDWDDVEMALHAIDLIAINVEMLGRCAIDNNHSERLDGVFGRLRSDLEENVLNIERMLGLKEWTP